MLGGDGLIDLFLNNSLEFEAHASSLIFYQEFLPGLLSGFLNIRTF